MRSFCLTFLLLLPAVAGIAQEKIVISNDPPPPAVRYPLVSEFGNAQVFYDQRNDETIARSKSVLIYGREMDGLSIAAEFISKGQKVTQPRNITLKIFYFGPDRIFVDDRTLKILVDNKELIGGTSKFIRANESNVILAALEKEILFADLIKISESTNVKVQIGPASFVLLNSAVKGFGDLIHTVER